MVKKKFGKKNFMQLMKKLKGLIFFPFGGKVRWGDQGLFALMFSTVFPSTQGVSQVPNVFLKTFPITPPFLFHIVLPWFNFNVYNL
jgi:hypothetical protein